VKISQHRVDPHFVAGFFVESSAFEKLQEKIERALERFAGVQREKKRLEQLASKQELENKELKKRLEHATQERNTLKQRLIKVMEGIDSLNI
jgi:F0F1-type ATP synthase delta subunit